MNRDNGYFAKKDYAGAIAEYDQALKLNARSAYAFHTRGLALYFKQEYDRAIADYGEALRLQPKFAEALNDRGLAYQAKGDLDRALADYQEAIRLKPNFTVALGNRDAAVAAKSQVAEETTGDDSAWSVYRALNFFGDVFERVRSDYVTETDDWALIQGALRGLMKAPVPPSSAIDPQQLCQSELANRTAYDPLICFGRVWDEVRRLTPQKISSRQLIGAAVASMLAGLDERSSYMSQKAFDRTSSDKRPTTPTGGLGFDFTVKSGLARVVSTIPSGPAARAGILPNDIIIRIDDQIAAGLGLDEIIDRLEGPVNSAVKVGIKREGLDVPLEFSMLREFITVNSVLWRTAGQDVGYVRISGLGEETTGELRKAMDDLNRQIGAGRMKGFVIDLRNNPGGLVDQAVSIADAFLDRGEIMTTRGRSPADPGAIMRTPVMLPMPSLSSFW